MSGRDLVEGQLVDAEVESGREQGPRGYPLPAVVTGELVGITDDGRTPLVLYPGQPGTAAFRARTVIDLHGTGSWR